MGCGCGSTPTGPPLTSGDLQEAAEARYRVITEDGEVHGFDRYRQAADFRAVNGGRLEA